MSIIQDKLGNEFLRNGAMEPNFAPGMLMFSHLPPVTSFTRMATAQSVLHDLAPQEMVLKKERDSPDCSLDYAHGASIKQEKLTELDYRLPLYPGCSAKGADLLMEASLGNHHQNLLAHDLSLGNVSTLGGWGECTMSLRNDMKTIYFVSGWWRVRWWLGGRGN